MSEIEIVDGGQNTVPEQELKQLSGHLTDELFPLLRAVRDRTKKQIGGFVPYYDPEKLKTMHRNYGLATVKKLMEWTEMDERRNGRIYFAQTGGQHVGMIGYQYSGDLKDGREVYEIRFASTLPQWRGRGIFGKLNRHAYSEIRNNFPDACITVVSASPAVIDHYERHYGWTELNYASEESEISMMTSGDKIQPEREEMAIQGFRLFCYDPELEGIIRSISRPGAGIRYGY